MSDSHTNPKQFGFSADELSKRIFSIELPDPAKLDPAKAVEVYGAIYQRLCSLDPGFEVLQWSYSCLARAKGTILNRLYHIKPEERKGSLLTEEQWTAFRKYCPESDDTLENYRNIAHHYPLENTDADKYGVYYMIRMARGEAIINNIGKNLGSGGEGKKGEKKPKPYITKVADKLDKMKAEFKAIAVELAKGDGLLDKPDQSEALLCEAEGLLVEYDFPKLVENIRIELRKAVKVVQAYRAKRIPLQRKTG